MPTSNVTLLPFQEEGVQWLDEHPRSILGDEMGLGKTIQVGEVLRRHWSEMKTVLIVGRGNLGKQWQDEFSEKFGLDLASAVGDDGGALNLAEAWPYVYINYAKLRVARFMKVLRPRVWDCIIVDEAHKVKGRNTLQMMGLRDLARRTDRLYFLTGTPEPNGDPSEIWSWLHCIDPRKWRSYWAFVEEYCEVEEWGTRRVVVRAKDPSAMAYSLRHVLLRRRERDVHAQLSEPFYAKVRHDLTQRQRAMYTQMKREWLTSLESPNPRTASLAVEAQNTAHQFSLLRKLAASPRLVGDHEDGGKIGVIRDLLEEAVDAGRKVVIFTFHRDLAVLIDEHLTSWGYPHGLVLGGVDDQVQQQLVDDFQRGQSVALVGTLAMLAEGWNLQAGSVAIFAQQSYVPAENEQAVRRLHRIGQTRQVNVYSLVAANTVEEHIWNLVRKKGGARSEIDAARAIMAELLREEGLHVSRV